MIKKLAVLEIWNILLTVNPLAWRTGVCTILYIIIISAICLGECWREAGAPRVLKVIYVCQYSWMGCIMIPWETCGENSEGGARAWLTDVLCSRNTGAGLFNEQKEAMWTKLPHLLPSHLWWVHFGVSSALFTLLQDKLDFKLSHMELNAG